MCDHDEPLKLRAADLEGNMIISHIWHILQKAIIYRKGVSSGQIIYKDSLLDLKNTFILFSICQQ